MRITSAAIATLLVLLLPIDSSARAAEGPDAADRRAVPLLDGVARQIVPGVYTLGELPPVTAYLIEAGDGLVLVDTGYSSQLDRLARSIASLGLDPNRISHILVTHKHLDHWMNMDWIRQMTGARTYMGRADAEAVEKGLTTEEAVPARLTPPKLVIPPTRVDYKIDREQVLPIPGVEIRAIPCPGHTPGSTCYYLETGPWRILFGGDTFMSVRSGLGTYTTRLHPRFGGETEAYRTSLARLRGLEVNLLLPGHPYFDRERTGRHPHPVLSSEGWRAIVDSGLRELESIERRYREDGRDFLDGSPKELARGLIYLGSDGGEAAYALRRGDEHCLVDPHRLAPEVLNESLRALGLLTSRLSSVLLTRLGTDRAQRVRALLRGGRIEVFGNAAARRELSPLGSLEFRLLEGKAEIEACGLGLEVASVSSWDGASLTYFATLDGEQAAFTGDAILPTTADDHVVPLQRPPSPPGSLLAAGSLAGFESRVVTLWLPGHPFAAQNANLYDQEWRRLVRANRLTLAGARSPAR